VRKNSSGYALDRFLPGGDPVELIVGSEGTLAVVTSVTFDLAPIPEHHAVVILGLRDRHDLPTLVESIPEMGASACEFFGLRFLQIAALADHPIVGAAALDAEFVFLVEFDGTAGEVSERVAALHELASELGARTVFAETESERKSLWEIRHAASPLIAAAAEEGRVSTQIIEDSVVPPDVLGQYLAGLDRILEANQTDAVIFGHAGDGNVHVNPLLDVRRPSWRKSARTILNETVDLVAGLGGTLSGEHGDGRIRAPFLESIWGPTLTDSFRRTKEAIDPVGILNPGVILPRPGQDPLEGLWPQHGIAT
jgi:FAD/FMN-containing dehydrogenase